MDFTSRTSNVAISDAKTESVNITVVIPCFKVTKHILNVISSIGSEVKKIYVIDDSCPDESGNYVLKNCNDPRVKVLMHSSNLGVGGAVMTGYREALADNANIIVKIDGDGQMDPGLIMDFVTPILAGEADYTKGNRFFNLEVVQHMPTARLLGNAALSFMTKLSSGYWDLFDPTNGYTAIHGDVAKHLPFKKISARYFFETDMLFRLNTLRAVVVDIPMVAKYDLEESNLKISKIIGEFLFKHLRNLLKRIFYNYYLRDMSLASLELPIGLVLFIFGSSFGAYQWANALRLGSTTSAGTVMLAALPVLTGIQLLLAFLGYDIANVPRRAFHRLNSNKNVN